MEGAAANLLYGFSVALEPVNLVACFAGVLLGTSIGVLPGFGPVATMALLLPSTFGLEPATAMIMLAGIFYGSLYGGSTTSILIKVPGEAASVVTCIDGHEMARKGRGGAALAVAAVGSCMAGTIGTVGLMLFAPPLADFALRFGAPEYFALLLVSLVLLARIGEQSMVRALLMVGLGLALGTVGMEQMSGSTRFTFGNVQLSSGIGLVPVIMGLYGVSEILRIAERTGGIPPIIWVKLRELFPTREEWRRSLAPMFRGSLLGFFIGLFPGPASILSTFASYVMERRISRHPDEFGKGAIEGVAGPEAANNSGSSGSLVPLLALGLPFSVTNAVLLGGLMIHGVQPGPLLISQHPDIFWGVVASMYVGNLMLLVLNLPLVGVFTSLLRIPQPLLSTIVLLLCLIGAFSVNNSLLDVQVLIATGFVGYLLCKLGFNMAPLMLGMILGPLMEQKLGESLIMTRGDVMQIVGRPLSATVLLLGVAALAAPACIRAGRRLSRSHARLSVANGSEVSSDNRGAGEP